MKRMLVFIEQEWNHIIKDSDLRLVMILAPFFYGLLYGSFYFNKIETKVPICVVDSDQTTASKSFIRNLEAHPMLKISEINDMGEAMEMFRNCNTNAVLWLEPGFQKHSLQHAPVNMRLYLNNTRFFISNDVNRAVNDVALDYDMKLKLRFFNSAGISGPRAGILAEPIQMDIRNIYNEAESYGNFIIPSLLMLVIAQILLMSLCQNIGLERESGILSKGHLLEAVTKKEMYARLFSKGLLYFIFFVLLFIVFTTIYYPSFHINPSGSYLTFLGVYALFLIAQIELAIFAGTWFDSKLYALIGVSFSSYPVFFLSGYVWPGFLIPSTVKALGAILPSTPLLQSLTVLLYIPTGFPDVAGTVIHLLILIVFYFLLNVLRFKYLRKKLSAA